MHESRLENFFYGIDGSKLLVRWTQSAIVGNGHGICLALSMYFSYNYSLGYTPDIIKFFQALIVHMTDIQCKDLLTCGQKFLQSKGYDFTDEILFYRNELHMTEDLKTVEVINLDIDQFLHAITTSHAVYNSQIFIIGCTFEESDVKHALSLVYDPSGNIYIFDPAKGLLQVTDLNKFFKNYADECKVDSWELSSWN